jgi:hypothetical protein
MGRGHGRTTRSAGFGVRLLTDVQRGEAGPGWMAKRKEKAERALAAIDRIVRA